MRKYVKVTDKGEYIGRNAIIKELAGKSHSTKVAVYQALKTMLDTKARAQKVLAIAKANGIKIKVLH